MGNMIIHIGYHKTASSYLQHVIFPQFPVNLVLPDEEHLKLIRSKNRSDLDLFRSWIENQINSADQQKTEITILSHEALSGHPHGYKKIPPFQIAQNLADIFPNAKILVVVRNQFDYITSLYSFRVAVKGEEYRNLEKFIKFSGRKGLFEQLEYHLLIEEYQRLFGRENVLVLPMELLIWSPEEFIREIMIFIGIPELKANLGNPVNVSTKITFILNFWRPINFIVYYFIRAAMLIFRKRKQDVRGLTYRFHSLKQKITALLIKKLKNFKKIDIKKYSEYQDLQTRFGLSNARLQKSIKHDLLLLGYPIKND